MTWKEGTIINIFTEHMADEIQKIRISAIEMGVIFSCVTFNFIYRILVACLGEHGGIQQVKIWDQWSRHASKVLKHYAPKHQSCMPKVLL